MCVQEFIKEIYLDEGKFIKRSPEIEMEKHRALSDLKMDNSFSLVGFENGPYHLELSIIDNKLILNVKNTADEYLKDFSIALLPFKRIVHDYFLMCENFYKFAKLGQHNKIEAIDMGRRGLHDEGAEMLINYTKDKVIIDKNTSRRLFTLICVLHIRCM